MIRKTFVFIALFIPFLLWGTWQKQGGNMQKFMVMVLCFSSLMFGQNQWTKQGVASGTIHKILNFPGEMYFLWLATEGGVWGSQDPYMYGFDEANNNLKDLSIQDMVGLVDGGNIVLVILTSDGVYAASGMDPFSMDWLRADPGGLDDTSGNFLGYPPPGLGKIALWNLGNQQYRVFLSYPETDEVTNTPGLFYKDFCGTEWCTSPPTYAYGPESFETGNGGFTADPLWVRDGCGYHTGSMSFRTAVTPTNCPDTYGNNADASLTSPSINLGPPGHNYKLRFWTLYDLEANFDYGIVEVSSDGGMNWTTLDGLTGQNGTWEEKVYDLSSFSGDTLIRFRITSDDFFSYTGWYIDDVEVSEANELPWQPMDLAGVPSLRITDLEACNDGTTLWFLWLPRKTA